VNTSKLLITQSLVTFYLSLVTHHFPLNRDFRRKQVETSTNEFSEAAKPNFEVHLGDHSSGLQAANEKDQMVR